MCPSGCKPSLAAGSTNPHVFSQPLGPQAHQEVLLPRDKPPYITLQETVAQGHACTPTRPAAPCCQIAWQGGAWLGAGIRSHFCPANRVHSTACADGYQGRVSWNSILQRGRLVLMPASISPVPAATPEEPRGRAMDHQQQKQLASREWHCVHPRHVPWIETAALLPALPQPQ